MKRNANPHTKEHTTMPKFEVTLEERLFNAPVGTTCDEIVAEDAAAAEAELIAQWKQVKPGRTFHPLLTIQK